MRKQDVLRMKDTQAVWLAPPESLALKSDEVHVWRASIDISPNQRDGFAQTLSQDEQARAERFLFQKDHDRFIASHGLLRLILGSYIMTGPEELVFCYNQHGKPALSTDGSTSCLDFNMSHSHDLALIAVTAGRKIGIDMEFIRTDFPVGEPVMQFCPQEELLLYDALSKHDRQISFFRWWVRNEACLKAIGQGLSADPREIFRIPLVYPAGSLQTMTISNRVTGEEYTLIDLDVGFGYAAALALHRGPLQVRCWQWPHP